MWIVLLVAYIATWAISWAVISLVAMKKYNIALGSVNYNVKVYDFMQGKISIFGYLKWVLFDKDEAKYIIRKLYRADSFLGAYAAAVCVMCMPLDVIAWLCTAPILLVCRAIYRKRFPTLS